MQQPDFAAVVRSGDLVAPDEVLVHARRLVNRCTRGTYEIHYDTRTVKLADIDGDSAMRIHTLLAEYDENDPTSARWADRCDPRTADATSGWLSMTPGRVLGSRWRAQRYVFGANERRRILRAACRLLDANPNVESPDSWPVETLRDYLTVLEDYRGTEQPVTADQGDQAMPTAGDRSDSSHRDQPDGSTAGDPVTDRGTDDESHADDDTRVVGPLGEAADSSEAEADR